MSSLSSGQGSQTPSMHHHPLQAYRPHSMEWSPPPVAHTTSHLLPSTQVGKLGEGYHTIKAQEHRNRINVQEAMVSHTTAVNGRRIRNTMGRNNNGKGTGNAYVVAVLCYTLPYLPPSQSWSPGMSPPGSTGWGHIEGDRGRIRWGNN